MGLTGSICGAMIATLLMATGAHASGQQYEIHAKLLHDGKAFATPAMLVRAGEPGTIESTGPDAFKLVLTATAVDAHTVRLEADLDSAHGSAQPTLIVRAGESVTITAGVIGLEFVVTPRLDATP